MYRFQKVQFYLIFSISIFTSNIAYSGLLDNITQILKKAGQEIGKTPEKPADRVDDERSQSIGYFIKAYEDTRSKPKKTDIKF